MEEADKKIGAMMRRRGDAVTRRERSFPVSPLLRVSVSCDDETNMGG